jgi:hypothetical protein
MGRCFKKCVGNKFPGSTWEKGEQACVQNCVDRFFDSHFFILTKYLSNSNGRRSRLDWANGRLAGRS